MREVNCLRCKAIVSESECYNIVLTTNDLEPCLACRHGLEIARSCSVWDSLRIGRMYREREKQVQRLREIYSKICA